MAKYFMTLHQESGDSVSPVKLRLDSIIAMRPELGRAGEFKGYVVFVVSGDEFEVVADETSRQLWEAL